VSAAAMFRTEARVQARERVWLSSGPSRWRWPRSWLSSTAARRAPSLLVALVIRYRLLYREEVIAPSPHRLGLWLPPQQPTRE
jgi:hypothetical protein